MQIIQGIREKGAAIVITVIALSLVGFILMDSKSAGNNMANSRSTTLGKVNGTAIEKDEYEKKVQQQEQQQEQQMQGAKMATAQLNQLREQVWNQMVEQKAFLSEAEKLGIDFTIKEFNSILSSSDQSNPILAQIADATGKIDPVKLKQVMTVIKQAKDEQKENIDAQLVEPQTIGSIYQKYVGLLEGASYYPSWMEEKETKDAKNFANITYVAVPFTVINDSSIKVTDDEVEKYVKDHKAQFKQEAGRTISYISFTQLPNQGDSAKVKESVENLKNDFAAQTESNIKSFMARQGSTIPYDTNYIPRSRFRSKIADTVLKMPIGTVYGPYIDNDNYSLVKVLATKVFPDTVKARHILIGTVDVQTRQPTLDDSTAKKRADSINTAISGGADFAALVAKYSDDQGSKDKGGEYPNIYYGQMVPEFNDFVFSKPAGSRAVVKTAFGYHIIEVESQKGSSPVYKVAYMAKEILASEATITAANNEALKAATIKDPVKLNEYIQNKGLKKTDVPALVKENDFSVGQLQDARQLIRWVFESKKGDVSDPYNINDQFVVAIVNDVYEKGTQDVKTARPMAEAGIREEKKAAEIFKKLGANPTLESTAAAYPNLQIATAGADSSITFSTTVIKGIGQEPKLIGAIFNKDNLNKVSAPIAGRAGVYVLKVNGIAAKSADTPEAAAAFHDMLVKNYHAQTTGNWFQSIKDQATIKDKRSEANY